MLCDRDNYYFDEGSVLWGKEEKEQNTKKVKTKKKKPIEVGHTQGGPPGEYPVKPLTRRDAMEPFRMTVTLN
jgi:hypothetical protein